MTRVARFPADQSQDILAASRSAAAGQAAWPRLVEESPIRPILPHRLRPPRSLLSGIERNALYARIEEGLSGQVVTIHAPGGFGKTEAVAAFFEKMQRLGDRFYWMTLDPADRDPRTFLHDLAAAIATTNKLIDQTAAPRGSTPDLDIEQAIARLGALLLAEPGSATIFLDDFHAAASPAFCDCFDLLLRRLPPETRFVLTSRGKPEIPVSRLRVRGLLTEIAADDLTFSRNEMLRLFAGVLTPGEVQRLLDVTGGWPALAQLARLALAEKPSPETKEEIFSGRHVSFSEFLNEEILSGVPESVSAALSVCATVDSFPQELVTELAGAETAPMVAVLIEQLSPALQRPHHSERWLRMTPVLRATLRARPEPVSGPSHAALHVRAASWFAGRGFFESAVSHAAHGGDFGLAVESIREAGGVNIFLRLGYTVLRRLLSDLPAAVIYAHPELRLCQALVLSKEGQIQTARDLIESLKAGGADNATIPPSDLRHIDGMIDIYEDRNLDENQIAKLQRAAEDYRTYNTWERGWIYNHLCIAYQRSGDLRAARLTGLKALSCYQEERTPYAQIFMLGHVGTVLIAAGRLSAAANVLRQADQLVQETQWSDTNIGALVNIPRAACLYHQGEIVEASRLVAAALPLITRGEGWVDMFAQGFSTYARAKFVQEGLESGLAVLDQGEVLAIERGLPRLELSIELLRIELLTRGGQLDLARHLLDRLPPIDGTESDHAGWPTVRERHEALCAKARLMVRSGAFGEGLAIAEHLIGSADRAGMGLHVLSGRAIAVEALWGLGRPDAALDHLLAAIAIAVPQKATQFMRDGDATMATVLKTLIRRVGLANFSREGAAFLAAILGPLQPRRMGELNSSASVILTRREAEVLAALNRGATNKRIAGDLGLTEAAIKFHMRNLFRKLGVSRRMLAISVARDVGLIPRTFE